MFYFRFFTAFLLFLIGVSARLQHVQNGGLGDLQKRHPFPQSRPAEVLISQPLATSAPGPTEVQSVVESSVPSFSLVSLATSISPAVSIQSNSSSISAAPSTTPSSIQPTPSPASGINNVTSLATSSFSSASSTSTAPATDITPLLDTSDTEEKKHQTLVIVLSVIFGLVGLAMIFAIILFIRNRRRGRPCKYRKRGVTPIDDEEIETWRRKTETYTDEPSPHSHHRQSSSTVVLSHAPSWTWKPDPTLYNAMPGGEAGGDTVLSPPPMVARAPNARTGLTDGAIPSADPFITPPRRQSIRLGKHVRSQSRKSSFSHSLADRSSVERARHSRDDSKNSFQGHYGSSPPVSMFNGYKWPTPSGPPPSPGRIVTGMGSREGAVDAEEIGRAS